MNNEYIKQARNFLDQTQTKLQMLYIKNGKHFGEDDQARDIYSVTLSNKKHMFTFNYGQSIANQGKKPTSYDILAGLSVYDYDNVDDFALDFGYEKPSEALRVFNAVRDESNNLKQLFTEQELELLAEIN